MSVPTVSVPTVSAPTPIRAFLAIGVLAGVALAFVVPSFAGIDEPYHYLRSWSLTGGTAMPTIGDLPGDVRGGGLCIPSSAVDEMFEAREPYLSRQTWFDGKDPLKTTTCPGERDTTTRTFVDMATFAWYSPVGYAPQAIGVGLGRLTGMGPGGQSLLARLASLAAYLAVCGWAIAGAPRSRWGLVAVALLPVSLFQATTSLSPDGIAIAASIAVVAAALRARHAAALTISRRRVLSEAALTCGLLALSKPTYAVVALLYVIVLLPASEADPPNLRQPDLEEATNRRMLARWRDRGALSPSAIAACSIAAGSIALSAGWSAAFRRRFVCDVRYFGVATDADGSLRALLHRPWEALLATVDATLHRGWEWVSDLVAIGPGRIVSWPTALCAIVLLAVVGWAFLAERDEVPATPAERGVLLAVGSLAVVAVVAGWLVSCSPPGLRVVNHLHGRLLVPALAPLAAGFGGWLRPRTQAVTTAVAGVACVVWIAWVVSAALTMTA